MNWEQLKTIFWLRWRLQCNQWTRRGGFLGVLIAAVVGFGAFTVAAVGFTGAFFAGLLALKDATPEVIMEVWLGVTAAFLFFWLFGLITELQRSETIDLSKLMHLPVLLGQLFVINYLISHFAISIVFLVPVMLGLALGLGCSRGPEMWLLIPLALSMVLMITAWTYCLRGWLATLMSNPRRRRTVIMCLTFSIILAAQVPNLYFNVLGHQSKFNGKSHQGMLANVVAVQAYIPPLWLPAGAQGLAEQRVLPALAGTLGCLGLAALGLRRAYRGTLTFYHGGKTRKTAAPRPAVRAAAGAAAAKSGRNFLEWRLPAVPEQPAVLALATFRSFSRAPEVKMALAGSVIALVIIGAMTIFRPMPPEVKAVKSVYQAFFGTGAAVFSVFMLVQFFSNQFGLDRDGFRSLILSPVDRRFILLGKNLALLPFGLGYGVILLVLVTVWLHLPWVVLVASLFQLATLLLLGSLMGNLLSILVPFRIQPGTLKPTKMPALAMLAMILCQFLFPVAMSPVFIAPLLDLLWGKVGGPAYVPVNLIVSVLLCGVMISVYWLTLPALGRLLQRRETKILSVVTVEVE